MLAACKVHSRTQVGHTMQGRSEYRERGSAIQHTQAAFRQSPSPSKYSGWLKPAAIQQSCPTAISPGAALCPAEDCRRYVYMEEKKAQQSTESDWHLKHLHHDLQPNSASQAGPVQLPLLDAHRRRSESTGCGVTTYNPCNACSKATE